MRPTVFWEFHIWIFQRVFSGWAESADPDMITDEMLRISPSEMLVPDSVEVNPIYRSVLRSFPEKSVGHLDEKVFDFAKSRRRILEQFNTISLEGFGCEHLKAGVGAAGALLYYVKETQKQDLAHLKGLETYSLDHFLIIDDNSCKNLELLRNIRTGGRQGSLLNILDTTVTAMGGRLMKNWLRYPLLDARAIESRLDAVSEAVSDMDTTREIRAGFKSVFDLQRIAGRIAMGHSNARDLLALKRSLTALPPIRVLLERFTSDLFQWEVDLDPLNALADVLEQAIREDAPPTINEGGIIKKGFHDELDELIDISRNGKGYLAKLEVEQRASTGINSLKVRYNKVFGYYIEIPKTQTHAVPPEYVRKQTLVNAERYITEELKDFETKVLNAEEKRATLEYGLFNDIRNRVMAHNTAIQQSADFIARVDCLLGLAETADRNNYHRPENQSGRSYGNRRGPPSGY